MPTRPIAILLFGALIFFLGVAGGALLSRSNQSVTQAKAIEPAVGILERIIVEETSAQQSGQRGTFDQVLSQPIGFQQYLAAYYLAENSSITDLRDLIKQALGHESRFYRSGMATIFFEKFVELDARQATDFALNGISSANQHYNTLVSVVFREWGRRDPEAALDALSLIDSLALRQGLLIQMLDDDLIISTSVGRQLASDLLPQLESRLVARRIRRTSPQDAFQEALSLGPRDRQQAMYSALTRWLASDPEAALAGIEQLTDRAEKSRMLNFAFGKWAASDPEAAITAAPAYDSGDGAVISTAIGAMARYDHAAALEMTERFRGEKYYDKVVTVVLGQWSQIDPAAAIEYMESSGIDSPRLRQMIAMGYARKFPEEAMSWAETLGDQMIQQLVFSLFARNDANGAERYVGELGAGSLRDSMVSQLAAQKAKVDGKAAIAWLSQYEDERLLFQQASLQVVVNWISHDASAATEYVENLIREEHPNAQHLAVSMTGIWSHRDPQAARRWADGLESSSVRDQVIQTLAANLAQSDLDGALELLGNIQDESTYSAAAMNIARSVVRGEPERFDEIVDRLDLTTEEVEQLRQSSETTTNLTIITN